MVYRSDNLRIPVVDLFAGPGGLGEGFSAPLSNGVSKFRIALSIEKDPIAHQTLELRAVFRQFDKGAVPSEYYALVRGQIDRQTALNTKALSAATKQARTEAWRAELGQTPMDEVNARISMAVPDRSCTVLIGGPPCQAYSLIGRSRNRGNPSYRAVDDARHFLYREYLKVLASLRPAVFVMENVKGLLSARLEGEKIFSRIVEDLSHPDRALSVTQRSGGGRYRIFSLCLDDDRQVRLVEFNDSDPNQFVVRSEEWGVPQARHRLIVLGIREDVPVRTGTFVPRQRATTADAIRGLPALRSGLSRVTDGAREWLEAVTACTSSTWFRDLPDDQKEVADVIEEAVRKASTRELSRGGEYVAACATADTHKDWYLDEAIGGVLNHSTRGHIVDDLHRYIFASAFAHVAGRSPVLDDFPPKLLPRHRNLAAGVSNAAFADRFRVQLRGRPASTVASHISKDGNYYIHYDPSQCRSLTVREAARLQTFPDNYFFCGPRTAQYHQVGNAVPPLLAQQIAEVVADVLS